MIPGKNSVTPSQEGVNWAAQSPTLAGLANGLHAIKKTTDPSV